MIPKLDRLIGLPFGSMVLPLGQVPPAAKAGAAIRISSGRIRIDPERGVDLDSA